jgi:hypothetical protein
MKVVANRQHREFLGAIEALGGTRIKAIRTQPLRVGGRTELVLFVGEGDREHPRLVATMPDVEDPRPPAFAFAPDEVPVDLDALAAAISAALREHARVLSAADVAVPPDRREGSQWFRNNLRGQRHGAFFAEVRKTVAGWFRRGKLAARLRVGADRVIRTLEDRAFVGRTSFDDVDTGTYHSYGNDQPFVHYLEDLLAALPVDGTEAMAVLQPAAQEAVRRQRRQAQAHLDALMRSKYAFSGVVDERDVERTTGGLLVDRRTRQRVTPAADSDPAAPQYELWRIDPAATHPQAGAWIWRDADGVLHTEDGRVVEVDDAAIRRAPIANDNLTFVRAPGDPRLRPGIALDWNDDGVVDAAPLQWVSWAGHCDVKAVMEAIGLALADAPTVTEFRSDTGKTHVLDRSRLLEMAASIIELGSEYESIDGSETGEAGTSELGGARNDARPDRLVFAPSGSTRRIAYPDADSAATLEIVELRFDDGPKVDLDAVFSRWVADVRAVELRENPHWVRTTDDDVELDARGAQIVARATFAELDRRGRVRTKTKKIAIDLRSGARGPDRGRFPLGAYATDERRITRVFYDPRGPALVRRDEWAEPKGRGWTIRVSQDERRTKLTRRRIGVVREVPREDPSMYRALVDAALRRGQPICADTDAQAPVWNGVVTQLDVTLEKTNEAARTELWAIAIEARFGKATLRYLVERGPNGAPVRWCAVPPRATEMWPDFIWSELPDVASKANIDGRWMVNRTMVERGMVEVEPDRSVEGGFYVHDEHVKHVYELVFCALSGHRFTVVHDGKRYGFRDRAAWQNARKRLLALARELSFAQ